MMIRNDKPSRCHMCGLLVPPGEGVVIARGGTAVVRHAAANERGMTCQDALRRKEAINILAPVMADAIKAGGGA